jgi:phosphoribosylanthranilate isomerase
MYHLRIKICGITRREDALEAVRLGADALGFNFYTGTPRHVPAETAASIIRELPPWVDPVGLFVNEPLTKVFQDVAALGPVRTIQWHGDDPPINTNAAVRFIPAFQVRDANGLKVVAAYLEKCAAAGSLPAAVLLDGHRAGEYGGTGQVAPWKLLADFQPPVPVILAGGLTAENVTEAVRMVRPYGVDVAGGVECEPGRKDAGKMRRFIENARQAAATA